MKYHRFAFIMLLIDFTCGYITYDTGFATQYNWENGFLGNPNTNYIKEFIFSGTFERPPQVSIVIYKYNYDYYQPNGYDIQVTEITTSKFKVQLRCLYQHRVWDTPFNWYAYDDRRIQVISVCNFFYLNHSSSFQSQLFKRIHPFDIFLLQRTNRFLNICIILNHCRLQVSIFKMLSLKSSQIIQTQLNQVIITLFQNLIQEIICDNKYFLQFLMLSMYRHNIFLNSTHHFTQLIFQNIIISQFLLLSILQMIKYNKKLKKTSVQWRLIHQPYICISK